MQKVQLNLWKKHQIKINHAFSISAISTCIILNLPLQNFVENRKGGAYGDTMLEMDHAIGLVLEFIEKSDKNLKENTLFLLVIMVRH